ncbi:hypothetical protein [Streptomyces cadmiisoli]|uniref:hypothetical protein n=1 Tax=Streptomyces cadmiisoli TaxID=2184053 RepID=UPI0036669537
MKINRISHRVGRAGIAALLTAGAVVAGATSAAADDSSTSGCAYSTNFRATQIQVDNCPGTGSSWAWLKSGPTYTYSSLEVKFKSGVKDTIEATGGTASSRNYYGDRDPIVEIKACNSAYVGFPIPIPVWECSVWTAVPQ